jgi:uncharacterized protein YajQ (UPF0234 family)
MPTFDVVSEVDPQEVRNAVDQASREIANRYDFKDTHSSIDLGDTSIELHTKVEDAAKGTVRQTATLNVGISDVKAREIGKFIKGLGLKGVSHQVQGQQLRVSGKKRDDLQTAIAKLRETDFGIPLQFTNFRD